MNDNARYHNVYAIWSRNKPTSNQMRNDIKHQTPITQQRIHETVQAHSAKADQNPYVLRTPGILEMCLNAALKPTRKFKFLPHHSNKSLVF